MSDVGLLLTPLTPLLLMLAWLLPGARLAARREALIPWVPLPALLTALLAPAGRALSLPGLLVGDAEWGITATARPLILATALVWAAAGHFARGYLGREHRQRFWLCWLLAQAGNLGLLVAADVVSFYSFFSLMTFAAYGLVVHDGGAPARRAGRVYMAMALVGEVAMLGGLLVAAGSLDRPLLRLVPAGIAESPLRDGVLAALLLGFGVKAGLPMLHMWLPLAHPAAPAPASAVLSGAMIKAGLYGWLLTLPLGSLALPNWGAGLALLGSVAALAGAAIGVTQRDGKAVLAYSSISQMGIIVTLVGAGLVEPEAWPALQVAVVFYAVHHSLAKGALFLSAGWHARRPPLRGWRWAGVVLPALALVGAPLTSGAMAKSLAKQPLGAGATAWLEPLILGLNVAAVGTGLLMIRYGWCVMRQGAATRSVRATAAPTATARMAAGWGALALLSAGLPLWGRLWQQALTSPAASFHGETLGGALAALGPMAVALLLGAAAWRHGRVPCSVLPGDVLGPLTVLGAWLWSNAITAGQAALRLRQRGTAHWRWLRTRLAATLERLLSREELVSRYGGHAFVALALLLAVLMLM